MYIITDTNNIVYNKLETIEYTQYGQILVTEDTGFQYVIGFQTNIYEVSDEVAEDIEPFKHCYTEEDGIYPNPNYEEPVYQPTYEELQARVAELEAQLLTLSL